jgi:hypothetical protein
MAKVLALLVGIMVLVGLASGSSRSETTAQGCSGVAAASAANLRILGHAVGDMDGDGHPERVIVWARGRRPIRCRYLLAVRQGARLRTRVLAVPDPVAAVQGYEPHLIGLAGVARGPGVEAVVDSNCCGAYVTGQWLFRETKAGLRQMHVRQPQPMTLVADTFPNGASICCGATPVCGRHRGIVLIFGQGRYAKAVDKAEVWVQHRDRFVYAGRKRMQRPGRLEDFQNCRPWVPAGA